MKTLIEAMQKAGTMLAVFALIGVVLVSTLHLLTRDRIAENEKAVLLRTLNAVIDTQRYDNDLLASKRVLEAKAVGGRNPVSVYFATKENKPVAAIFEVSTPDGYSGTIRLVIGVNAGVEQRISGVRVITHKETPGLGDDIEARKSDWILGFTGRSLNDPSENRWYVKKDGGDFDEFTGATITPRAVVAAVRQILLYSQTHLNDLFLEGK